MGAIPLVAIPHPLAGNDQKLVRAKADAIAGEVAAALVDPAEEVAARYAERFVHLTERRLERGAVCLDEACVIDPVIAGARK